MAARPLLWIPVAVSALFFGAAGYQIWRNSALTEAGIATDALPSTREGQPAPPLALSPLGDLPALDDAALRAPGVKLVNIWASWCAPCRVEHPTLVEIAASGIPVYGVNYKDDPDKALGFLSDLGNPYAAVGADPNGRTAIEWGAYGVPETFVIDGAGVVRLRFAGPITPEIYQSRIRPAIEAAAAR